MIKLINILNELNIHIPPSLKQLERWRDENKSTKNRMTKIKLAYKCAKSILYIWERENSNNTKLHQVLELLKSYIDNPSEENRQLCINTANSSWRNIYINSAASRYAAFAILNAADLQDVYYVSAVYKNAINAFKTYHQINELSINNPAIKPDKVYNYYHKNIFYNNLDDMNWNLYWVDYIELCKPYMKKYNIDYFISNITEFEKLSKSDLYKLYNEMQQLVQKYGK